MKNKPDTGNSPQSGDDLLKEMWRIKDTLSASYGHDINRLFEETRKREKSSGHPLVSLADLKKKRK